ncbi:MAG: glycoside hydrolase family protein [Chitinophagales bacterium]|nr:glycoside hydrolase family protein [Chitinophagales bacterium]
MTPRYIIIAIVIFLAVFAGWLYYERYQATQLVEQSATNYNVQAFLKAIRYAEGTDGANGYRTMFTGKLFDSYTDHPRQLNCSGSLCSTAAGAYQFLSATWDDLRLALGLNDFSPANQDKGAIELIRRKNALNDVTEGRFETAIAKVNTVWASLPGAPYGQPTKTMAQLKQVYTGNGGNFA